MDYLRMDRSLGAPAGTWEPAKLATPLYSCTKQSALIRCPGCGRMFVLTSRHSIGKDGRVTKYYPAGGNAVGCPHCKWKAEITLVGFKKEG
jgi:hypothetical protein